MTLMWGQKTTAAIKSEAEIRYRTYGRHFREEGARARVARKNERLGSAVPSHSKILEGLTCFQGLWGCMWPLDEDAAVALGLFRHSEPVAAFPSVLVF